MHFFGTLGTFTFLLGFIITISLIVSKLMDPVNFALTNRPSFFLALTTMIIGTLFFLTGFVAELISRSAADRNNYLIEEKIGLEINDKIIN